MRERTLAKKWKQGSQRQSVVLKGQTLLDGPAISSYAHQQPRSLMRQRRTKRLYVKFAPLCRYSSGGVRDTLMMTSAVSMRSRRRSIVVVAIVAALVLVAGAVTTVTLWALGRTDRA